MVAPPLNSLKYMAGVNDGSLGRCRGGHRNGTPWAVMADMTSWQMVGGHHMVAPLGSIGLAWCRSFGVCTMVAPCGKIRRGAITMASPHLVAAV